MSSKREEKALFEFKHIMDDLMQLAGRSAGAETAYLYWVNRSREQFVLETSYTVLPNVMFKDRIGFDSFFLDQFKDIKDVVQIELGKDLQKNELLHYYDRVPTRFLTIVPFENNQSTVALTVLETYERLDLKELEVPIAAYRNAHMNVLNTYLELTDLYDNQKKWAEYGESADCITTKLSNVEVLNVMTEEMQKLLPTGGVSVVLRGMETWVTALRSADAPESPALGLIVEDKSMSHQALQKGETLFSIHFNQNPKRVSTSEASTEGATLAIPVLISDKRCAMVLAYDRNPLVFKKSIKYQLKNLVKIASLTIQANSGNVELNQNLLATEYGNFTSGLMDMCLQNQLKRTGEKEELWFGLIGIENLSELRARFRLEDLKKLQRLLVKVLNPSRVGLNGLIGFYSDYVYSYIMVSSGEDHHEEWLNTLKSDLRNKLDLGDGRKIEVNIKAGSKKMESNSVAVADLWKEVKSLLSAAMKNENASISGF